MITPRFVFIALLCGIAMLLSGCPCDDPEEAARTPLSGRFGYYVQGPFGLEATITKATLDDVEWTFKGNFTFPSSGYLLLPHRAEVMESYPEQVHITFYVWKPSPGQIVLPALTEAPVNITFAASNEAQFTVRVVPLCLP